MNARLDLSSGRLTGLHQNVKSYFPYKNQKQFENGDSYSNSKKEIETILGSPPQSLNPLPIYIYILKMS